MQQEQILTKVQDIITECHGVEREEIMMSSRLMEDLGIDSILMAEIVMMMEDAFGLRMSDEEAGGIRTVSDAVFFIEAKLAAKAA